MTTALFALALSCTSGGDTNDTKIQTAQTQVLDSDGIPTGGKWITMFDGKTLDRWHGCYRQGVPQSRVVEDRSITYRGSDNKADTGFDDLIYDKKLKNFAFEIEWKIDKAGNDGVFHIAQEIEGTSIYCFGPEYQLLGNENMPDARGGYDGNCQAGAVYNVTTSDPQPVKPYGNWSKARIAVHNQRVVHYMSDVKILEFQFGTPVWRTLADHSKFNKFGTSPERCPETYDLMLQCGKQSDYVDMQDRGYGVYFRNVRIKEFQNRMRIEVCQPYETLSLKAKEIVTSELGQHKALTLCATTEGSSTRMYKLLTEEAGRQPELFSQFTVLKLDEWGEIPMDHPGACESCLQSYFIDPLQIPEDRYIAFQSNPENPEVKHERTQQILGQKGPIDICILKIGMDGHITLNEPTPPLHTNRHVAHLSQKSLQHFMIVGDTKKPGYGLTLGMANIFQLRLVILFINGIEKREATQAFPEQKILTELPVSLLWLYPNAICLIDKEAAHSSN